MIASFIRKRAHVVSNDCALVARRTTIECIPDNNTPHESTDAVHPNYIVQQFISSIDCCEQESASEQMELMQTRLDESEKRVEFHRERADEYKKKLLAFEVNEASSNYSKDREIADLKFMLAEYVQRERDQN